MAIFKSYQRLTKYLYYLKHFRWPRNIFFFMICPFLIVLGLLVNILSIVLWHCRGDRELIFYTQSVLTPLKQSTQQWWEKHFIFPLFFCLITWNPSGRLQFDTLYCFNFWDYNYGISTFLLLPPLYTPANSPSSLWSLLKYLYS